MICKIAQLREQLTKKCSYIMNITNNGKKYIGFLLCGSVQARVENIKLYVKSR